MGALTPTFPHQPRRNSYFESLAPHDFQNNLPSCERPPTAGRTQQAERSRKSLVLVPHHEEKSCDEQVRVSERQGFPVRSETLPTDRLRTRLRKREFRWRMSFLARVAIDSVAGRGVFRRQFYNS